MSKSICIAYVPAHALVLKTPVYYMPHSTQKNAHTPVQARPCDSAATSSPCKPLQPILKLEFCLRNYQNPRQPMTQLWSHRHHTIIRVGAGPIQIVYGSQSCLAADLSLHKLLFPPFFCGLCIRHRTLRTCAIPSRPASLHI